MSSEGSQRVRSFTRPVNDPRAPRLLDHVTGIDGLTVRASAGLWALEGARVADVADGYDDFFRTHYPRVVRVVHGVLGDRARAEEVAQEAFIRLYQRWSRVSMFERPDAWVRRVAIRLAVRMARRDRLRTTLERRADRAASTTVDAGRDGLELVGRLPRNQRLAIVLHYVDDLAVADVAAVMGCAEATVRVHLHRGRRRMAELMSWEVQVDE